MAENPFKTGDIVRISEDITVGVGNFSLYNKYRVVATGSNIVQIIDDRGKAVNMNSANFTLCCPAEFVPKYLHKSLDFYKPIKTRLGNKVRIISVSGRGEFPVIYTTSTHNDFLYTKLSGKVFEDCTDRDTDLVNYEDSEIEHSLAFSRYPALHESRLNFKKPFKTISGEKVSIIFVDSYIPEFTNVRCSLPLSYYVGNANSILHSDLTGRNRIHGMSIVNCEDNDKAYHI